MKGILYIENFINTASELFEQLKNTTDWDTRMSVRKTARFGVA